MILETFDKSVIRVTPYTANIFNPVRYYDRDAHYIVSWHNNDVKVHARSQRPPLVTVSNAGEHIAGIFDECDARNIPRDRLFVGVELALRIQTYRWSYNGREGFANWLFEVEVDEMALNIALNRFIEEVRA